MFQLHVKDYQLAYGLAENNIAKPYIKKSIGSVCFVNVYLMPKSQFLELVSKITSSTSPILPHKISYGDSIKL